MPLYRYRSFEEAERDLPNLPGAASAKLFELAGLRPPASTRGLLRFRTLEEANRHRQGEQVEAARKAAQMTPRS